MPSPNKICQNIDCRKEFYGCNTCDEKGMFSWRVVCCSRECFQKYMQWLEEKDKK